MKLKADLFPYPVLSGELNDYINSTFTAEFSLEKASQSNINLNVIFNLDDASLNQLILKDKAQYAVHLEGVASSYRKLVVLENLKSKITIPINADEINSKVEVNTMILTKEAIESYTNPNFNPDFYGKSYTIKNLNKGDILAFDSMVELNFDFQNKERPNAKSMIRVAAISEPYMSVNLDGDVIQLYLPTKAHEAYQILSRASEDKKQMLLVTIVLPALTYVIERMKNEEYEKERSWAIALTELLLKLNYDEQSIKTADSMKIAQQLLDTPVENALFNFYQGDEKNE